MTTAHGNGCRFHLAMRRAGSSRRRTGCGVSSSECGSRPNAIHLPGASREALGSDTAGNIALLWAKGGRSKSPQLARSALMGTRRLKVGRSLVFWERGCALGEYQAAATHWIAVVSEAGKRPAGSEVIVYRRVTTGARPDDPRSLSPNSNAQRTGHSVTERSQAVRPRGLRSLGASSGASRSNPASPPGRKRPRGRLLH